jgi:uncharacterized membrane protein YjdF
MKKPERIKLGILIFFRVLIIAAGIFAIFAKDWLNVFLASVTLLLTFLPDMIERRFKVDYPSEFEIILLFFIYGSLALGEIHGFYTRLWWWDLMLHGFSAIIVGIIGFSLIYILNKEYKVEICLTPMFIAIFSFCFAIAIGALWEVFEFSMDTFFGLNMQKSGLLDTMSDIMVDIAGALTVSIIGYLYLKGGFKFLKGSVKRFKAKVG